MTKKILIFFGEIIGITVFLWLSYALLCMGYNFKPSVNPINTFFLIFFTILFTKITVRIFRKEIKKFSNK